MQRPRIPPADEDRSLRDAEEDAQAIDAAVGAWHDRDFDGEGYVESIRSGSRRWGSSEG